MRIRCALFGCCLRDIPACHRCGAALYDADFIQLGWLEPLIHRIHRLRALLSADTLRCTECRRLLTLPRLWREWKRSSAFVGSSAIKFCSDECHDNWFPF
jgi:hypothetical protein